MIFGIVICFLCNLNDENEKLCIPKNRLGGRT